MSSRNPTNAEIKQGYLECQECKGILLLESGFELKTSYCEQCGQHVASKEEFFNVPVELMSK